MIKPNLFLIGAPKCGTTTVSDWLGMHPSIFMAKVKEPHFFFSPYGASMTVAEYEALFNSEAADKKYRGEASVWYLFGKDAVSRIEEYSKAPKYIVCLRNPIEMAPSLHAQKLFTGHELEKDFSKAWALSKQREKGEHVKIFHIPDGDSSHMAYQKSCLLGEQVERLLDVVKRDSVHFVLMDDLKRDPSAVWMSIENFLGVGHYEIPSFSKSNEATKRKSLVLHYLLMLVASAKKKLGIKLKSGLLRGVHKANVSVQRYDPPSDSLHKEMCDVFKPDIEKLSNLINRDLSGWYQCSRYK